jgi:hypothetical protein
MANNTTKESASPNTRLVNSMKVKIYSVNTIGQGEQIGLIQSWAPNHSRTLTPNRGIGYGDQIAEVSVGVTDITASAESLGMYLKNIMQSFGYKSDASGVVRSLKHHKWPFDVWEEIVIPTFITNVEGSGYTTNLQTASGGGGYAIRTRYDGCWMSSWSHSFTIGDVNVSQSAELTVTDVYDDLQASKYGPDLDDRQISVRSNII